MEIFLMALLFFVAIALLLWQASNIISIFFGSPYVGAQRDIIQKALNLADLKRGEIFYELGCGTGEVLLEAQKIGAKAVGFEISPFYFLLARMRTYKYKNIEVRFQDIRCIDLSKAEVIYCYLMPRFLKKMAPKFKKELKKSSRLISIGFPVPGIRNGKMIKVKNRRIFIYSPSSRSF